ncbi:hypothetical protein [Brevibacillus marinus]|uniref:hypothetical protein n=1 Tax=Brevibacillus marinus TaxID=2496837 RepID=UPI000F825FB3|nr:hypothetical protein [Brevibacillus marinus]
MVIRPHHLWWLLPLFFALFLLGAIIGKLADKPYRQPPVQHVVQNDPAEQVRTERRQLAELIERWETGAEIPFQVELKDRQFSGTFRGKTFQLAGAVGGHQVTMARQGDTFTLTVDGQQKEPLMLPFALYTPYDHLMLIKGVLQSIVPIRLTGPQSADLIGYQFSLPPEEVKEQLSHWLGSRFPAEDVMDEVLQDVSLTYQMWYEAESKRLRRMTVTLKIASPPEDKMDQLLFRM